MNYADVIFQPSSSQHEIRIIGLEDRNVYTEVDTSVTVRLPEVQSDTSSSDDDFVYVDGIPNFIEKRETNDWILLVAHEMFHIVFFCKYMYW